MKFIKTAFVWALLLAMLIEGDKPVFARETADTSLVISTPDTTLQTVSGSLVSTTISVTNTGSAAVNDVKPQIDLPYKWLLNSAEPSGISLRPDESATFTIKFSVPASQTASTNTVKIVCANTSLTSNELTIPITISTDIKYLWMVVGAVAILLLITIFYFKKHGRR